MSKIFIYGSGAFALALGSVLVNNGNEVVFYCRDKNRVDELNATHLETKYFKNELLDSRLKFVDKLDTIKEFNIILIATPSSSLKDVVNHLNDINFKDKILFISAVKGLESSTNSRVSEFFENSLDKNISYDFVSLLGPGFAKNIIKKDLTCISAVSRNKESAKFVQRLFSNGYFRVYTNDDLVGAEFSSSIKNAIAIASGILCGLGYKENSRSALITRGLNEMVKFGTYFGAKRETYYGLTGVGDLTLTASSVESRNFSFGKSVGELNSGKKALELNKATVEGINTVKVIYEISAKNKIDMPIIVSLYKILFENATPNIELSLLMDRPLKEEN